MYLNGVYGSGLPFNIPGITKQTGYEYYNEDYDQTFEVKSIARMPSYKRVDIGISNPKSKYKVRELWKHQDLPNEYYTESITQSVKSHDVVALKLTPVNEEVEEEAGVTDGQHDKRKETKTVLYDTTATAATTTKLRG